MVSALAGRKVRIPTSLRQPARNYTFEYLEGPRVLCFQFCRAQEQTDEPLAAYANGFHSYSRREYPERKPYYLDMDVDSVEPDILVQASSRDWLAGRDAELEAVLRAVAR